MSDLSSKFIAFILRRLNSCGHSFLSNIINFFGLRALYKDIKNMFFLVMVQNIIFESLKQIWWLICWQSSLPNSHLLHTMKQYTNLSKNSGHAGIAFYTQPLLLYTMKNKNYLIVIIPNKRNKIYSSYN